MLRVQVPAREAPGCLAREGAEGRGTIILGGKGGYKVTNGHYEGIECLENKLGPSKGVLSPHHPSADPRVDPIKHVTTRTNM